MKNDTMKLLESIQNNINKKSLKESELLDDSNVKEYDNYSGRILAETDLYLEEDADELGISVDEVLDRMINDSGVKLISKKAGFQGAISVSVLGRPSQIARFFSGAGLYDNENTVDSLYELVTEIGFDGIEVSKKA